MLSGQTGYFFCKLYITGFYMMVVKLTVNRSKRDRHDLQ